ncbi:hypothetical protein EV174_002025 [Coemansia sp. RSA 2320]|nr:hypothetical protein EV174_002025 [Coemansia sp. RSA 2320]
MTLIYARVGDMKRRSHRLKDHRAKQDQRIAEWMDQERTRLVPAASASLALAQSLVPGSTAIRQDTASVPPLSLSASGVDDVATPRSVPSLRRMPSALASRYGDLADDGPGIAVLELPASVPSVALAMGEAVDRSSSSPGTHEVQDAAPPPAARMSDAVHPVAIKRKGKRRVRMPTIE